MAVKTKRYLLSFRPADKKKAPNGQKHLWGIKEMGGGLKNERALLSCYIFDESFLYPGENKGRIHLEIDVSLPLLALGGKVLWEKFKGDGSKKKRPKLANAHKKT